MRPSDFSENRAGDLVKTLDGHWAFVPSPLPPKLQWDQELIALLSEADRAVSRLGGVGEGLRNPHLLIRPFLRREAVLSSRIEGTRTSLSELFYFEAAPTAKGGPPDVREVANYVRALEYGLERIRRLPICLRLLRELHQKLLEGARGRDETPGEFRRVQNLIGPEGATIANAVYVPPPVPEMHEALDSFEKYLHAPSGLPPLIRLAAIHYQFESIHPFCDGNGRIGRLLISLQLCTERILTQPLLYLSAYFDRNRQEYYQRLLSISQRGDWAGWMRFFLTGVTEESLDVIERINRLGSLQAEYQSLLHSARSSALLLKLLDELFAHPAITARRACEVFGITHRAAQDNINRLVDKGLLVEITGRKRNRVYVAPGIIEAVEGGSTAEA